MRLYPRKPGNPFRDRKWFSETVWISQREKAAAHRLLDRLKAGEPIPGERIEWALRQTGDA